MGGIDQRFLHQMGMASLVAGVLLLMLSRVWPDGR
jgi:hypothetical protein